LFGDGHNVAFLLRGAHQQLGGFLLRVTRLIGLGKLLEDEGARGGQRLELRTVFQHDRSRER
jgi:hypothetical protein